MCVTTDDCVTEVTYHRTMMSTRALGLGSALRKTVFSPSFSKSVWTVEDLKIFIPLCVSSSQPSRLAEDSREAVRGLYWLMGVADALRYLAPSKSNRYHRLRIQIS